MSVLLMGSHGFLGSRIQKLHPEYQILPAGFLKSCSRSELQKLLFQMEPEVIIHTAAISNTAYCADHPEESYQSNVQLPEWIAEICKKTGSKLIAFSSDQVYAGSAGKMPHLEEEILIPSNVYGRQKLEMEERVLSQTPAAVLLRATWMYDFPTNKYPNRANFITNFYSASEQNQILSFSSADFRGITWVWNAAEKIPELFSVPGGTYNFGCMNSFSMLETAVRTANLLQQNVLVQDSGFSRNLCMDGKKLQMYGIGFRDTMSELAYAFQQNQANLER